MIYKNMTVVSKNMYIDELDKIVDEFNQTYHITMKMKPYDVKSVTYIEYDVEHNDTDSKFKIGNHVRTSQ